MKAPKLHRNAARRANKPTRKQKRELMERFGITSGRGWKKVYKAMQRAIRARGYGEGRPVPPHRSGQGFSA